MTGALFSVTCSHARALSLSLCPSLVSPLLLLISLFFFLFSLLFFLLSLFFLFSLLFFLLSLFFFLFFHFFFCFGCLSPSAFFVRHSLHSIIASRVMSEEPQFGRWCYLGSLHVDLCVVVLCVTLPCRLVSSSTFGGSESEQRRAAAAAR